MSRSSTAPPLLAVVVAVVLLLLGCLVHGAQAQRCSDATTAAQCPGVSAWQTWMWEHWGVCCNI